MNKAKLTLLYIWTLLTSNAWWAFFMWPTKLNDNNEEILNNSITLPVILTMAGFFVILYNVLEYIREHWND